jgi:hypothetical protein
VTIAETPAGTDEVIDDRGARVFIDEQIAGYLAGKVLDARMIGERVSFVVGEARRDPRLTGPHLATARSPRALRRREAASPLKFVVLRYIVTVHRLSFDVPGEMR